MNLDAKMTLDTRQFQAGLSQARQGVSSAQGAFSRIAGIVANPFIIATAALGGFAGGMALVRKSLDLSAEMETLTTSFSVMLKSAEAGRDMMERIKKTAATTPFELPGLASAAKSLLAFRVPAGEIIPTLRMLGDISSGTGKDLGELSAIFGKARTNGILMTNDLNQLANAGIPIFEMLAKKFQVNAGEIRKMAETGKIGFNDMLDVFESLTKKGGDFFGMMGTQSKTFSGLMSTLRDSIAEVLRSFGTPIMEALKPVLAELTARMEALRPIAAAIGQSIGTGLTVIFNAVKSGQLGHLIQLSLTVAFKTAVNYLVGLLAGVGTFVKTLFAEIFSKKTFDALTAVFDSIGLRLQSAMKRLAADFAGMIGRNRLAVSLNTEANDLNQSANLKSDDARSGFAAIGESLPTTWSAALAELKKFRPGDLFKDLPKQKEKLEALLETLKEVAPVAGEVVEDALAKLSRLPGSADAETVKTPNRANAIPNVDNFARVGLFIGGGPSVDLARRTAKAAEETVKAIRGLYNVLGTGTHVSTFA